MGGGRVKGLKERGGGGQAEKLEKGGGGSGGEEMAGEKRPQVGVGDGRGAGRGWDLLSGSPW